MSPQEEGRTPRGKGTGATGPGTPDNSKHGPALLKCAQLGKHDCRTIDSGNCFLHLLKQRGVSLIPTL